MTKNISKKNKQKLSKKTIILICLGLFILVVTGILMANPILKKIDQNRFISLDKQMQKLLLDIETGSSKDSAWSYEKNCNPEYSGPWPTGFYNCSVAISMDKNITSATELNEMHSEVYPIIDGSNILKATSELETQLPGDFGVDFVVSLGSKDYLEVDSKISCRYSVGIYQQEENITLTSDALGSKIENDSGKLRVWINCAEKARSDWYLAD